MDVLAEIRNLTKTFDRITVLNDVSIRVHAGEILGLLGPNGSGKTTLLKILALLEKPTNGKLYFLGKEVMDRNIQQLRMQTTMVFQKTVLFSTSVYNNVSYGLKLRKASKKETDEKVEKALKIVGLEGFEKRDAKKLSGGEQQRVALARALTLDTKLLLLDEPTANLDPTNASIIEQVIRDVNQDLGTTIVLATHNMFQAQNLPKRIALITNGKIGEVGDPQEIFGKLSRTLARFAALGNSYTGVSTIQNDGTALVDIGNNLKIATSTQRDGQVTVYVSPEDIILSRNPFESSARNVFKGTISEIQDAGSLVRLGVEIGKLFVVQITKRSFVEMKLNLDREVYLTFKASSVQII